MAFELALEQAMLDLGHIIETYPMVCGLAFFLFVIWPLFIPGAHK